LENHLKIKKIYQIILGNYSYQGWWPLSDLNNSNNKGYHPKKYDYPKNEKELFEICLGCILTQNTTWINANKAISNLNKIDAINPKKIIKLNEIENKKLLNAIKPAGYYNQKLKKIIIFSEFFVNLKKIPSRDELLKIWGIGKETADSMLLYGFNKPLFVIDSYTKRIFSRIGICDEKIEYDNLKKIFENSFNKLNDGKKIIIYNEYHALIVEHAKRNCKKKPICNNCIIKKECNYGLNKK
jgi:endonuclease III related protein